MEPWRHPAWDTDRAGVVARYLALLDRVGAATGLPVEVDVAWWLHTVDSAEGPLDVAIARRVDRMTAMTYRDTVTGTDSITDLGRQVLATAAAARVPCRLAVETRFLGTDPVCQKQTFWGQGPTVLSRALAGVDAAPGRPRGVRRDGGPRRGRLARPLGQDPTSDRSPAHSVWKVPSRSTRA